MLPNYTETDLNSNLDRDDRIFILVISKSKELLNFCKSNA